MKDLTANPKTLDPIEVASLDEIISLQLDRMKWSLRHAYNNVPFYKKKFDSVDAHPDHLKYLEDIIVI